MNQLIGDIELKPKTFDGLPALLESFKSKDFLRKTSIERNEIVNRTLFELIDRSPEESFLLSQVVDYLAKITELQILDGNYNLTAFERWINQLSDFNYEENRRIRGKIVGKYIPRDEYNGLFPISQNKVHPGTHTVTAHTPPDLDSLTGSFLGWVDAFGCRVGSTLTVWNVPLGKPGPVASRMFSLLYSDELFTRVAKQKTLISHVAMDIVQQDRFIKATGESNIRNLNHNRYQFHIVQVDQDGFFLGDWRVSDVDAVAQVQRLLNMSMHAYEKEFVFQLTKLFSRANFKLEECQSLINELLTKSVPEFNMQSYTLSEQQIEHLDLYMRRVLGMEEGYRCSIGRFFQRMDELADCGFSQYSTELQRLVHPDFYDNDHISDHSSDELFDIFHKAYNTLIGCTKVLRNHLDRLDVAMGIKTEVLGYRPTYVGTKAEINEIRSKMVNYRHLTVVFPDNQGRYVPVGVIHRDQVEQSIQGTVSFRDFCNYDEIKLHDYLEVISAIDHHKSTISSKSAMVLSVADVQSCNVITAEKYFEINDRYSTRGQSLESINQQIIDIQNKDEMDGRDFRLLEKLFRKKRALKNVVGSKFFINPERELQDYILCLNAIVDDTDLLNKCGWRDLTAIAELVNRIKSLQEKKEVEIIDFSECSLERRILKKCIREMLECKDLYSFYKIVYEHREQVVDELIRSVEPEQDTRFFEDRKLQNHSCSISQFKLFPRNWEAIYGNRDSILTNWTRLNRQVRRKDSEVDFFLHMMSTIPGGEEAYNNIKAQPDEFDEFWLSGIPDADESISRMRQFLIAMLRSERHAGTRYEAFIEGPKDGGLHIFERVIKDALGMPSCPFVENAKLSSLVMIFKFPQGAMNSRKADITPFLPK